MYLGYKAWKSDERLVDNNSMYVRGMLGKDEKRLPQRESVNQWF